LAVPEHIAARVDLIAQEYDRLQGIEPGAPGTRWGLVALYLLHGEAMAREPAELAAEIDARINGVRS